MKGGNKLFLFAGVGLALVAILLGITMSSGGGNDKTADAQNQQEEAAPSEITVVRLLQDIEQHQVIKAEMVETVEIDADLAPTNPVTVAANVVNQSYTLKASAGEILRQDFVVPPGITASIEPGMRAISIAVDNQGSMSGLVISGDYIDVVFEARVDIRRLVALEPGFEARDDGSYEIEPEKNSDSNDAGADDDEAGDVSGDGIIPYEGREGSEFVASDGADALEPVAKMLVQDVKVIRVIAPGETYDAQGQPNQAAEGSAPADATTGQLIIQVTPQQAEAIAFMQSEHHSYSIAVRGKDDHATVQTSGVTFQILMTDGTWSLPWPEPIVADDAKENRDFTPPAADSDDAETTPEADASDATPEADEETT